MPSLIKEGVPNGCRNTVSQWYCLKRRAPQIKLEYRIQLFLELFLRSYGMELIAMPKYRIQGFWNEQNPEFKILELILRK